MANVALSAALFALASANVASAVSTVGFAPTPLISQIFPHPTDAPYQVFPYNPNAQVVLQRGSQSGFNICNSTTENQDSDCQTMYVNGLDDFCLWGPPKLDTIADSEGEEVAWCVKKGHGTRIMPQNTILGAQLLKSKTNDYWMITGLINQTMINIQDGDAGGELDSGGQDGQGNPIGGLVYSTAFASDPSQITWWTEFIGNGQFCIKICNPQGNNNPGYCQHTLDRIGLAFNCPSKYTLGGGFAAGDFEVCDTDDMPVPGVYTDASGQTTSYAQPPESLGPITTVPYAPSSAASSNCVKTASSALFTDAVTVSGAASSTASGSSASVTNSASGSTGPSGSATRSASTGSPSATGGSSNGAATMGVSALSLVAGMFAIAIFA